MKVSNFCKSIWNCLVKKSNGKYYWKTKDDEDIEFGLHTQEYQFLKNFAQLNNNVVTYGPKSTDGTSHDKFMDFNIRDRKIRLTFFQCNNTNFVLANRISLISIYDTLIDNIQDWKIEKYGKDKVTKRHPYFMERITEKQDVIDLINNIK